MTFPKPIARLSTEIVDEEDYMNMTIAEPVIDLHRETYTQRRHRKEREAALRGRPKSKQELAVEERRARDAALATSLLENPVATKTNKGLAMMTKMGFTPGASLGKAGQSDGRLEPLNICVKEGRGGIGLDSERKRYLREEFEKDSKRAKTEELDYRERVRKEKEWSRLEAMVGKAMRICERMEAERSENETGTTISAGKNISTKPLKQINVLWRGVVRDREEKERDRRMRYDLQQSLSRLPTYEDPDEEADDKQALGTNGVYNNLVEDLEEEDDELDDFNRLEPGERLQKLVGHMRIEHNYCFWCKYKYPDQNLEGCPGSTEEDHD